MSTWFSAEQYFIEKEKFQTKMKENRVKECFYEIAKWLEKFINEDISLPYYLDETERDMLLKIMKEKEKYNDFKLVFRKKLNMLYVDIYLK